MISYIKGEIVEKKQNKVILECNGIGYEIFVSNLTLTTVNEGATSLFTHLQVRDDGFTLFGFASTEERDMFNLLISVSGIGAKGAISILSAMKISELMVAIAGGDVKNLSKIKGLGKKTAERLVVELKDKVNPMGLDFLTDENYENTLNSSAMDEAILVLTSLGLTKNESMQLVKLNASPEKTAEEIVADVLRSMGAK